MTYFGFLLRFLFIPILILFVWTLVDRRRGKQVPPLWRSQSAASALLLHVVIAILYTTPWDNYLVATRVWSYDPQLVTGFVIGWVPVEEYIFFMLQPILTGLWLLLLLPYGAGKLKPDNNALHPSSPALRIVAVGVTALIWLIMIAILIVGWQPGTYLALELGWALPPIMLQLGFGADILWRHRRLVAWTILPMTIFLSGADALAINWGTWTIDPAQSLPFLLGGLLPLEELLFFLLTNTLLTFGLVLLLSADSHERIAELRQRWGARKNALAR